MTIFAIHAYITLMNWSQFCVTLCYSYYMRNRIRHNYPSLIQCLRAFHILCFAYLLFRCYCYNHYKTPKILLLLPLLLLLLPLLSYYLLLSTLLQILSYLGVVELTTQLLILENILWLPLCRINKFWVEYSTLKSCCDPLYSWVIKTIFWRLCQGAQLYSSSHLGFISADHYEELKRSKTQDFPSTTRGCKKLSSSSALDSPSIMSKLCDTFTCTCY